MGLKIEGDGSYQNTKVWLNNVEVDYSECTIDVNKEDGCSALIHDGICYKECGIDMILIKGLYIIIGAGAFENTQLFFMDTLIRGIQNLTITISENNPTYIDIKAVLLPNLIEEVND